MHFWSFIAFAVLGILALAWQTNCAFSLDGCGSAKTCLRLPDGCDVTSSDCLFFSWIWNGTVFKMELSGGAGSGATYAGVAFGRVNGMQDADLYYCTGSKLKSGVIAKASSAPTELSSLPAGVTETLVSSSNGIAECTFDRAPSITKNVSGGVDQEFDLTAETHYILLARGEIQSDSLAYHGYGPNNRIISASQINMTALVSTGTGATTSEPTTSASKPSTVAPTGATTSEPTTSASKPSTVAPEISKPQNAVCGKTMGCYQTPEACTEGTADCTYFTWVYNSEANNFDMTISGGVGGGATYAGVAFGQVSTMQDADLYFCTGNGLVSGAITELHKKPINRDISTEPITKISSETTNGVAKCSFTRAASVTKPISGGDSKYFDLSKGLYHILLAQGEMASDGTLMYHNKRDITSSAIDMMSHAAGTTAAPETTRPSNTQCGKDVGCFQSPNGCTEGTADCTYFTWVYNSGDNDFDMAISGGAGGGKTYAGVAFGQVDDMQDADLYFCTGSSLVSSAITEKRSSPTNQDISKEPVSDIEVVTTNGVAKCTFKRAASVTKPISGGASKDFDLSKGSYYILLAQGEMATDGTVKYHGTKRDISSEALDMTENRGSNTKGVDILAKTHGALMITAWLLLANLGVVLARHFKPLWPETQLGDVKLWFVLHRLLMVAAFLCTTVAFIIIFVHVDGYSSEYNAHAIIGIIVMALAVLNPTIALLRPHPNTPKRPIFNWTHYLVGTCARGLGIANLFLGVIAIGLSSVAPWGIAVMGGFVGFVVVAELLFEFLSYKYGHCDRKSNSKPKGDPVPDSSTFEMETPNVRVRGQGVKTFVLIVYALGLIAFSIVFYVALSQA